MSEKEEPVAAPEPETPRRRRASGIPNISALLSEVDQQAEAAPASNRANRLKALAGFGLEEPPAAPAAEAPAAVSEILSPPEPAAAETAPQTPEMPAQAARSSPPRPSEPITRPRPRSLEDIRGLLGEKPSAAPQAERPRRADASKGLAGLFDEQIAAKPSTASGVLDQIGQPSEADENVRLHLAPDLEAFLSPDLWRKLNSSSPRRGVLINGLERIRSVLYLLSTFLPAHLVQEKMRRPVPGMVGGQILTGSLLFSDVSGFTALSERLAILGTEGAERLTGIMNRYFTEMLEILAWSGGILLKFAGDATLVYFPEQPEGAQARWAVRAGLRMLAAVSHFSQIETPTEKVSLRMKIGIASGEFLAANIGSSERMEYGVLGPTVSRTLGAEGASTAAGQLIVDEDSAALLGSEFQATRHKAGYFLVTGSAEGGAGGFEIKAEQRRARGAIPWSASPQAICTQMEIALRQIKAILPYLPREVVERVVVHAQQRQVDSEFRPVITIFCNFLGLEALIDAWGAEGASRVASVMSAYFNAMHGVIKRYGGVVTRIDPYSKGTKMLITFGAPVSHEDDPQRAVSTALSMNAELESLNERLLQKFARHFPDNYKGPILRQRIGITYGEIYAGLVGASTRREYTVMGDDVNLAARLMGAARPGQVLISQHVYEAVIDLFNITPLNPIRVKGKSKPIPIVQVDGPAEHTLLNRINKRSPLIARQAELHKAEQAAEQTLAGNCSLLILQGPAGIGKSHLGDEFARRLQGRGVRIAAAQCRSYTLDTPYACWSELLRGLAGITTLDVPQVHLEKLDRLIASLALPAAHRLHLAPLMGIKPPQAAEEGEAPAGLPVESEIGRDLLAQVKRGRAVRKASAVDLFEQLDRGQANEAGQTWQGISEPLSGAERARAYQAVSGLFASLSTHGACLVYIDDAHWMDAGSRDLLEYLHQELAEKPLLFLLARRDEDKALAQLGVVLRLDAFTVEDTNRLVASILIDELAPLIQAQSNGNPLFIEEISRWIQRTRKLSAADLGDILQSSDILQKLILSSIESLPEIQRELIRVASVIGPEFRTGEVQALLSSAMDAVTTSNILRNLASARLIILVEAGADALYAFQQNLVREILYNSLSFEKRRELHGKMADYLSAPRAARRELHARIAALDDLRPGFNPLLEQEMVAQHFEKAERFQPAGERYLKVAGESRSKKDYSTAARNYQSALAVLGKVAPNDSSAETTALKAQAALGCGELAAAAGNYAEAAGYFEAGNALPPADVAPEVGAALAANQPLVLPGINRADEALGALEKAFERFPLEDNGRVCFGRAWLAWRNGHPQAGEWVQHSAQLLAERQGLQSHQAAGLLSGFAGDWGAARQAFQNMENSRGSLLAGFFLGLQAYQSASFQPALDEFQRAAEGWSTEALYLPGQVLALYYQAAVHYAQHQRSECSAAFHAALKLLPGAPPNVRSEGRRLIKKAFKTSESKRRQAWPAWNASFLLDPFILDWLFALQTGEPSL